MEGARNEVKHFMRECERLFGFVNLNGGLTEMECDALKYYVGELSVHISRFCGSAEGQDCSS